MALLDFSMVVNGLVGLGVTEPSSTFPWLVKGPGCFFLSMWAKDLARVEVEVSLSSSECFEGPAFVEDVDSFGISALGGVVGGVRKRASL